MPRAFILEKLRASIDVSRANDFGDLHYIFSEDERRSSCFRTDDFGRDVQKQLERLSFNYEEDFFVLVGAMVPVAVAISAIVSYYPRVNVLLYNATEDRYLCRTIGQEIWYESSCGTDAYTE